MREHTCRSSPPKALLAGVLTAGLLASPLAALPAAATTTDPAPERTSSAQSAGAAESGTQGIDAAESQDSAVERLTAEGEPTDNVFGEVAGESSDERIAGQ